MNFVENSYCGQFKVKGTCDYGHRCKFLHQVARSPTGKLKDFNHINVAQINIPLCPFALKGNCLKGLKCNFSHVDLNHKTLTNEPSNIKLRKELKLSSINEILPPNAFQISRCNSFLSGSYKGSDCKYSHDVKQILTSSTELTPYSSKYVFVVGSTRVFFDEGLKIKSILIPNSNTLNVTISISNIPPTLTANNLISKFEPYCLLERFTIANGFRLASFQCKSKKELESIVKSLEKIGIGDNDVDDDDDQSLKNVKVKVLNASLLDQMATTEVLDCGFKVSWFNPSAKAYLVIVDLYTNELHDVVCSLKKFNVNCIQRNSLPDKILESKKKNRMHKRPIFLYLTNLPSDTTIDSVYMLFDEIGYSRFVAKEWITVENPKFQESEATSVISKILSRYGKLVSFEISKSNDKNFETSTTTNTTTSRKIENNISTASPKSPLTSITNKSQHRSKGLAIFKNREESIKVFNRIQGIVFSDLGNQRLDVDELYSMKKTILSASLRYVERDLELCFKDHPDVSFKYFNDYKNGGVKSSSRNPSNLINLLLKSNSGVEIRECWTKVNNVIEGLPFFDDKKETKFVWDDFFLTHEGEERVFEIAKETKSFIKRDFRRQRISFFGKKEGFKKALKLLKKALDEFHQIQNSMVVSNEKIRIVLNFGIKRLENLAKADEITLNYTKSSISVRGSIETFKYVKSWLNHKENSLKNSPRNSPKKTTVSCTVCFCDYDPIKMIAYPCQHHICKSCLDTYLELLRNNHNVQKFPLTCFADGCSTLLPFETIKKQTAIERGSSPSSSSSSRQATVSPTFDLDNPSFLKLCQSALYQFAQTHPNQYQFCPTPDCNQIYEVGTGKFQCDVCHNFCCTICKSEDHVGLSCEEYQSVSGGGKDEVEFLKYRKENDARKCPKVGCGAFIEKDGGCNHVRCFVCLSHICWSCMKVVENVYPHMSQCGGIYS